MAPSAKVVDGPSVVGGVLMRVVAADGGEMVELWSALGWAPLPGVSSANLWLSPPASPADLDLFGVPPPERVGPYADGRTPVDFA